MRPETRVSRWREIAQITLSQFSGDLNSILRRPYAEAKRALKQFPTIGDPGAEKILLFCGLASGLPLESNGLRVLVRLGWGRLQKELFSNLPFCAGRSSSRPAFGSRPSQAGLPLAARARKDAMQGQGASLPQVSPRRGVRLRDEACRFSSGTDPGNLNHAAHSLRGP